MNMNDLAAWLITASAAIALVLGLIHLLYTFRSKKFYPRDGALEARLREVSPLISSETTMWRAMVGFHASHSFGAMLFGAIYAYLALVHGSVLFQSPFLLLLGLLFLAAFLVLAKLYWFSVPFRGILLATALYVAALALWSAEPHHSIGRHLSLKQQSTMFARVITIQTQPGKLEEAVGVFRDAVLPAAKQQKGFARALLLTDPATGKAISITLWDTEADQKASEVNGYFQQQLRKVGAMLAGPPVREGLVVSVQP